MFCCFRIWIDFVVKGGIEMYKERVYFNNLFWSEQRLKLENFFDKIVLFELVYLRVKYGLFFFYFIEE